MRHFFKEQREPIVSKRFVIKSGIESVKENEKKLKNIISTGAIDMNMSVQLYKEVTSSGVIVRKALIEQAFQVISMKKEEGYKLDIKKLNPKDKNGVIKIMEDIKLNGWKISEELMSTLKNLSK